MQFTAEAEIGTPIQVVDPSNPEKVTEQRGYVGVVRVDNVILWMGKTSHPAHFLAIAEAKSRFYAVMTKLFAETEV